MINCGCDKISNGGNVQFSSILTEKVFQEWWSVLSKRSKRENPWMIIVDAKFFFQKTKCHFHLYKHTKRQEWMNEWSAPSKTGGRIGAVERCGRAAGGGTRAGAQQPSFSLSSLSSLALCLCACFAAAAGIFSPPSVAGFIFAADTISFLRQ